MSLIKAEDSKKWINAFVAIGALIVGFLFIRFFEQAGEWFDLEAKIQNFTLVAQGLGILIGLGTFIAITKHKEASTHMQQVYDEIVKVIWPDNESVVKATVGIVIGLILISSLFVAVDFLFREVLELIY